MSNGLVANVTCMFHVPIQRVWRALVDPEEVFQYMGAHVFTDWREGSPIVWKGEWQGKTFEDKGHVITVREPDLLKYGHLSGSAGPETEHMVTIELKEVGGVTHLRLTQDNNSTEEARVRSEQNWTTMFDRLKKMLGEAPVAPPEAART